MNRNEGVFLKSVLSDKDNTKFCIRCGMENSADADYCVLCGEQLYINNKNDYIFFCSGRIRRRRTALVLCAVLGGHGGFSASYLADAGGVLAADYGAGDAGGLCKCLGSPFLQRHAGGAVSCAHCGRHHRRIHCPGHVP